MENCEIGNTPDTRHKVSNTDSTIVRITSKNTNGIGGIWGTGIVIGSNKILTTAHVANAFSVSEMIVYVGGNGAASVLKSYCLSETTP